MSGTDKIKNTTEDVAGKAKEKLGEWTDNESLESEGRNQQTTAELKKAGENAKDAGRSVKDALTDD